MKQGRKTMKKIVILIVNALMLVLMAEYSLCGIIDRCFGFLLHFPSRKAPG